MLPVTIVIENNLTLTTLVYNNISNTYYSVFLAVCYNHYKRFRKFALLLNFEYECVIIITCVKRCGF